MKKLNIQPSILQLIYIIIFVILFCIIIFTPTLINGKIQITEKLILEEETIEGILLGVFFLLGIVILNLYKQEVHKQEAQIIEIKNHKKVVENRLNDSDHYIGILNVQIQEIKALFNSINEYPENKADLKKTLHSFSERILGIVNSNWVLIRIIDCSNQKSIGEHFEIRYGFSSVYPHVSNKMIIENGSAPSFSTVISNPKNLNILVACVMPVDKISDDQRVFIQAIINEITKMFIILNSSYYRKGIIEQ